MNNSLDLNPMDHVVSGIYRYSPGSCSWMGKLNGPFPDLGGFLSSTSTFHVSMVHFRNRDSMESQFHLNQHLTYTLYRCDRPWDYKTKH